MFRQSTNEEDLKAQVLSKFLKVQGDTEQLFDGGSPWLALLKYQTFVASLILADDNYLEVDTINEIIDKIREDSFNDRGQTSKTRQYNRDRYRNKKAYEVFHKVVRSTNRVLRDSGYYNFLFGGKDFFDPARGRKSFQRKK